jgi:hypothetical protein
METTSRSSAPLNLHHNVPPSAVGISADGAKLTREEEAKQVLEQTQISGRTARVLTLLFLLTIFSVPLVQAFVMNRQHKPVSPKLPIENGLVPEESDLKRYESTLEAESVVAKAVLPRAQTVLTGLGIGNEKAYVGQDGWLLYRADVDYVTGRGFLEPARLRAHGQEAKKATDPLPAIVRFNQQLAQRSIRLILLPTTLKPMLEPEQLSTRYAGSSSPLQNASYTQFLQRLAQHKVLVCDPTVVLQQVKQQQGKAQFLRTDTHWTPSAMRTTAEVLATFVRQHVSLPPGKTSPYRRDKVLFSGRGDIATMLKLPAEQKLYPPQQVTLEPVKSTNGQAWKATPDADVLLLGDSFTNIYSRSALGWGRGAGLAEQLSFALQRPLDVIAINAGGSYSTRRRLRDELLRGSDRLSGKRVVVWQFAMRDLMSGNWQLLDLPAAVAKATPSAILRKAPSVLRPQNLATVTRFRRTLAQKAAQVERSGSQVLRGSDGWLFYLPDIYYLSSGGFLRTRRNPQIDALVNFKHQLARRGIKLIVIPAPAKSTIYPEKLGLNIEVPQAPQNPAFSRYRRALQAQGITVFDPTETLLVQKRLSRAPLFMPTDSHWSYVAMESTTAELAGRLKTQLPARTPVKYTRRPVKVRNITDISLMLKRQPGNKQFVRVQQTIQQVLTPNRTIWKSQADADILVMGDSFVNMYSHGGYWGKGAGFAEQLSFYLQRPVDLIAMDRGGVNKTRRALQRDMLQGRDRLAGKKIVIYEVASRYLMGRNWETIQLPVFKTRTKTPSKYFVPTPTPLANQLVRATVAARSVVPDAATTPYPDLVMSVRLTNIQSIKNGKVVAKWPKDAVVYLWGMRNAVLTKAASWKNGQRVEVQLKPWRAVEDEFGGYDRTELEGSSASRLDMFWATPTR